LLWSLKFQFAVFHGDFAALAGFDFAVEQIHRRRVEQKPLDGALERTRLELRIVALLVRIPPGRIFGRHPTRSQSGSLGRPQNCELLPGAALAKAG